MECKKKVSSEPQAETQIEKVGTSAIASSSERYLPYTRAMATLRERLDATRHELAAWIFHGPKDGGIAAYSNANELDPPPRFYFARLLGVSSDYNYNDAVMHCWFLRKDIEDFQPVDRYITGEALIERWGKYPDIVPEAFIRAKIAESRLDEFHPISGLTQGTLRIDEGLPPVAMALFPLSQVKAVEDQELTTGATSTKATVKGESDCQVWLLGLMHGNSKPTKPKSGYQAEATKKFPVGDRGFARAWKISVKQSRNNEWSRPGRKSKQHTDLADKKRSRS